MTNKGIVLAGGEGKRLAPLGLDVPKPLAAVGEKPLINYNLGLFDRHGVRDVKIIIRPSDREAYARWHRECAGSFPKMAIELVEEPQPMGTFGYFFHHLREWMGEDDVFVTNGDDIKEIDLNEMSEFHRSGNMAATLALMHMERPGEYGVVLVKADKVAEFMEKQPDMPPGLVSAGMYLVSPKALAHIARSIPKEKRYLMFEEDFFPALARAEGLGGFVCEGRFFDCGTPERLAEAVRATRLG